MVYVMAIHPHIAISTMHSENSWFTISPLIYTSVVSLTGGSLGPLTLQEETTAWRAERMLSFSGDCGAAGSGVVWEWLSSEKSSVDEK